MRGATCYGLIGCVFEHCAEHVRGDHNGIPNCAIANCAEWLGAAGSASPVQASLALHCSDECVPQVAESDAGQ